MVFVRNQLNDLATRLGVSAETIQTQVGRLGDASLVTLNELREVYGAEALVENKFAQRILDTRVDLPPFGYNPRPTEQRASLKPFVERTYGRAREPTHPSASEPLAGVLTRRRSQGAKLARLVQENAEVRSAVGRRLGGEVVRDGRTDGTLTVRASTQAMTATPGVSGSSAPTVSQAATLSSMPSSQTLYDLFYAMDYEILMQAALLGQQQSSGASGRGGAEQGGTSAITNVLLGGKGSLQGMLGTTGSVSGLFGDVPEAQAGADGNDSSSSLDLGILQLKRMIDKRDQMVTAVKNVLDKWNQTAKVAVDNTKA